MHKQKLVVGTRSSQLALWQADFVIGELAKNTLSWWWKKD